MQPRQRLWRRIKSMTTMLYERSEGTKLLAPPDERTLLPERATSQAAVSVTTLFAAGIAHDQAERFAEFLSEKLGTDLELRVRHWSYNELEHLRAGEVAADLAEQTDVLLLITHADELLPPAVARWIAGWLLQANSSCAAVCLVGSNDCSVESPVARHLCRACEAAQIQFFVSGFTAKARHQRTSSVSSEYFTSPDHFEAFGIMHWGINE